MAPYLPL